MKRFNDEKKFRNVFSNIVIFSLIAIISIFCFVLNFDKQTTLASNSEYNGTIYAGDKTSGNVSLMVNVYWGNEHLEKMLDIFEKYKVKTTFFVGGSWALENQDLLKRIKSMGNEIASHGYSHKEHAKLSYEDNFVEIQKCHNVVKEIINEDMELFAPPSGSYNKNTTKAATDLGYKTIMWTRDTIDWRDKDASLIYNRAITGVSSGDLILMHPTACTAEALPKIIEYILGKNLKIATVSETLGL